MTDDWAIAVDGVGTSGLSWEILRGRYQVRSPILASVAVTHWSEQIGDPTVRHGFESRTWPRAAVA